MQEYFYSWRKYAKVLARRYLNKSSQTFQLTMIIESFIFRTLGCLAYPD
jgi:hypothetical protein